MISVHSPGKQFNITVIQSYAVASNVEGIKVEWFYEDLQDLLELNSPQNVFLFIGDGMQKWEVKRYLDFPLLHSIPYLYPLL